VIETQEVRPRSEVPVEFTWDLSIVYPDDAAWEAAVAELEAMRPEIAALKGTVGQSASSLLHALEVNDRAMMQAERIYVYAKLRKDADGTDPVAQALDSRAASLYAQISAALSFLEPEILAIPPETLAEWQARDPGLAPYAYYLDHLSRLRPHVRSAEVEEIMAEFADVTRAPIDAFEALTNADLTFPTIEDERGQPVQLSDARYTTLIRSADRRVRHDAFQAFFQAYGGVRTTLSTTLGAVIRDHVLNARLRDYPSSLAAALEPNDIPVEVYRTLISTIHDNLPRLHRYVSVRKHIMGLDEIHPYDLYAPLVPEIDDRFEFDAAKGLVRDALKPLGPQYAEGLEQMFGRRWIDIYENAGKQSGAYSDGGYTTPPFILLNYHGRMIDVSTFAHELGHSLHSFFTRQTQPFISGDYTTFVAEVASTLNEALLTAHLLATTDDPARRKQLIVDQLEGIRSTIFRQTMFAEFELAIHEHVEAGEALTSEWLSTRYRELVEQYYGPELVLDDEIALEWTYIPHFYFNFYVYQYATGKSAALALAAQIMREGEPAVRRYLRFLSSGSSRPSIDLLRDAGVDMTTPAPIQQSMDQFDALLNDLEAVS
ncbi:MAG TPA: oligoendopeptidase F, partial [Chloroflexota bacterium]